MNKIVIKGSIFFNKNENNISQANVHSIEKIFLDQGDDYSTDGSDYVILNEYLDEILFENSTLYVEFMESLDRLNLSLKSIFNNIEVKGVKSEFKHLTISKENFLEYYLNTGADDDIVDTLIQFGERCRNLLEELFEDAVVDAIYPEYFDQYNLGLTVSDVENALTITLK